MLGPTFDYTHRLIGPATAGDEETPKPQRRQTNDDQEAMRVTDILGDEALIEPDGVANPDGTPADLTSSPLSFPADRDLRLQAPR